MSRKRNLQPTVDPIRSLGKVSTIASFGLFVIIVINYVDAHGRYRSELTTQESLIVQDSEQRQRLDQYHAESEQLHAALSDLDRRAITEDELAHVQDQLLALAKENRCTIKKASPRGKLVRDFEDKESADGTLSKPHERDVFLPVKHFEIHETGLALSIEGDLESTMKFLEAVRNQPWFTSTRQLVLRRDPNQPALLATELELRFASLQKCSDRSAGESPAAR